MKIANVISKSPTKLDDNFNIIDVDNLSAVTKPTLIVGYKLAEELHGSKLDLADRKISDNLYWTFTKSEFRKYHDKDINQFVDYAYSNLISDINYICIDPIQDSRSRIKKIVKKIKLSENIISYFHNDRIVYLYTEKLIFGIDIELLEFIGLKRERVISKIKKISKVFLEGEEILIEYRKYIDRMDESVMYIPYLYSIRNDE